MSSRCPHPRAPGGGGWVPNVPCPQSTAEASTLRGAFLELSRRLQDSRWSTLPRPSQLGQAFDVPWLLLSRRELSEC